MTPGFQILFETRYSFFGQSGWRSAASTSAEKLLAPERLAKRLELFKQITLPCLEQQTDPDFKLIILTSSEMPEAEADALTRACHDAIGAERTRILFRPPGRAGAWLQKYVSRNLNDISHAVQIVLDDDDAVSVDFVARIRQEAAFAVSQLGPGQDCAYLSFANGISARFEPAGGITLFPRDMPFNNQGLALIGPSTTQRNPFKIAHKKVARRHPVRVFHDQRPYHIRAVHDMNDSRAMHRDTPLTADQVREVLRYFPFLAQTDLIALRDDTPAPIGV